MLANPDYIAIDANSPRQSLDKAMEILAAGSGAVLFANTVLLRTAQSSLICEVVDPTPGVRLCQHELDVLVENARRMLTSSSFGKRLPTMPCRWRVIAAPDVD